MVWLEGVCELSKGCPAANRRRGDAECRKELQGAVDTGAIDRWCTLDDLPCFERSIGVFERGKNRLSRFGETVAGVGQNGPERG